LFDLAGQLHRARAFPQRAHLYLLEAHRVHIFGSSPNFVFITSEFPQSHITHRGKFVLLLVNSQPQLVHWYVSVREVMSTMIDPAFVQISSGMFWFE
jgi:hypothetical protein